jgi:hypothetical protein
MEERMDEYIKAVFAAAADQRRFLEAIKDHGPTLSILDADDPRAKFLEQAAAVFRASAAPPA